LFSVLIFKSGILFIFSFLSTDVFSDIAVESNFNKFVLNAFLKLLLASFFTGLYRLRSLDNISFLNSF